MVRIAAEPGTDCPTWRIDANAAVPQPDGHGKRFQEQDAFDPDHALEVTFDVRPAPHGPMLCLYQHKEWWMRPAWCTNPADIPSRTQLVLWRGDERGDLPAAAKADAPTGVVLAGGKPRQDTDEPAPVATWTAVMAFSGDDTRADLHGDIGPESDGQKSVDGGTSGGNLPSGGNVVGSSVAGIIDPSTISGRFRLNVASNRAGRTALADTVAYVAQGADPYAVIRACVAAGARRSGIARSRFRPRQRYDGCNATAGRRRGNQNQQCLHTKANVRNRMRSGKRSPPKKLKIGIIRIIRHEETRNPHSGCRC